LERSDTFLGFIKSALLLAVVVSLALFALGEASWAKGFALGSLFSILNFVLLKWGIQQRLNQGGKTVKVKGFAFIVLRYAILAIPLLLALKTEIFNLPATIAGLFCIQLSIYFYYFVWLRFSRSKNRDTKLFI